MVGLVLVSHSETLVEGLREMVLQVAGDIPLATAGGTEDGRLGTSAPRIAAAIRSSLDAGADAALVEGAILAAVQASVGASIDEVAAAAESAATMAKMPR